MSQEAPPLRNSPDPPDRLLSYDFVALTLAAAFGFCNIAVFYGLSAYLEKIGLDPAWRGAVIAAEPLAALLARPALSLRLTPRRALDTARISLAALGVALVCYQFASGIPALIAVRLFHGLAFVCLVSAVTVLLTKVVTPRFAGRAFGLFSLSSLAPYAVMPPLMEWLLSRGGNEARAYAWTALLTLPALVMLLPLGRRLGRASFPDQDGWRPTIRSLRENLGHRPVALLLGANFLIFAGITQVYFFMKPYALDLGLAEPGLFFTVCTAASIAVRFAVGPYFDRLPRRATATAALLGVAACMALFALRPGQATFLILAGAYGFFQGMSLPLVNAAMFLESPERLRGMNMNLMLFMMDAGYTLGPLAGGWLLSLGSGYGPLFWTGAAYACAAAALLAPLGWKELRGR